MLPSLTFAELGMRLTMDWRRFSTNLSALWLNTWLMYATVMHASRTTCDRRSFTDTC